MANERLRGAIADRNMTLEQVAEHLGVSAKTVERWITTGRIPYQRHRLSTAALLKREVSYLWPSDQVATEVTDASNAEVVRVYPYRAAVPQNLWPQLYAKATEKFDVLVYSGFWLTEDPAFLRVVKEKAADGVTVRFMLGEPGSPPVAQRGEDEGIGASMGAKIRNALVNYRALFRVPGVEFRLHSTTLYNSIYRADDELLINPHIYGVGAAKAPLMHLQRIPGGELTDAYLESIERVWEDARPISSPTDC
ncbi:helix-turn-helix domain-containing protein [Streptomyces sp. NRRL S-1868]|uniref:helix-turn-helix domain-containing protein n=1 Tax=Streptomyces sp. NRRL S-1868 TaxID=1463892 RepID=UPI0004C5FF12|nr:helix-turn-helix domain-containing protein [Streptomyces sp. NRRL S-1868]